MISHKKLPKKRKIKKIKIINNIIKTKLKNLIKIFLKINFKHKSVFRKKKNRVLVASYFSIVQFYYIIYLNNYMQFIFSLLQNHLIK